MMHKVVRHYSRNYIARHNRQKINLKLDLQKMTDQKAEDDIENLEKNAKVDSKMESGGYVDMKPSLTGTSESM